MRRPQESYVSKALAQLQAEFRPFKRPLKTERKSFFNKDLQNWRGTKAANRFPAIRGAFFGYN
jgi:hypothetical protein